MGKNRLCCLIASTLLVFSAASQNGLDTSIYHLRRNVDIPVAVAGVAVNAIAFISTQGLPDRTASDVSKLKKPSLIGLDDRAISNYLASADRASDVLAGGSVLLPLLLLADKDMSKDALRLAALAAETGLITNGLTLATKRLVLRNRPYVFNDDVPLSEKLEPKSRLSFFSGHTSMTASMSFFTAKVWSDYHPDSHWKPVVWTAAATLPTLTGYLRHKAGKHFFTDVAAGYAVGALVGYFVPHFHKQKRKHGRQRLSFSVPVGYDGAAAISLHFRP